MPSITALTICTRSPASTYYGGTPVGTVDGCASDLSRCSVATGDAVSSKGSSSCQPWAPRFMPLLSKEGGSVLVPCRVRTILKFIVATHLLMILRIHTKCSDTNCNDPAF
ncbi:hypothetical protein Peur_056045 [Populus x canadensis]